jgi:hypothetical protein
MDGMMQFNSIDIVYIWGKLRGEENVVAFLQYYKVEKLKNMHNSLDVQKRGFFILPVVDVLPAVSASQI